MPEIFDKEKFLNWLRQNFEPMKNHFTYDMASNVVNYAAAKYAADPDAIPGCILQFIPQISEEDVAPFLRKGLLPGGPDKFQRDICAEQLRYLCRRTMQGSDSGCGDGACDECPISKTLELLEQED